VHLQEEDINVIWFLSYTFWCRHHGKCLTFTLDGGTIDTIDLRWSLISFALIGRHLATTCSSSHILHRTIWVSMQIMRKDTLTHSDLGGSMPWSSAQRGLFAFAHEEGLPATCRNFTLLNLNPHHRTCTTSDSVGTNQLTVLKLIRRLFDEPFQVWDWSTWK
jgi:hypothetical protein